MSAIIFCVSLSSREILTVVEDGQPVRWREWGLHLPHQPDQVRVPDQLHELQGGPEVPLVLQCEGVRAIYFESDGGGEGNKGLVLVITDRVDDFLTDFARTDAIHQIIV